MEVIGKVKLINEVQEVSASFKKREIVVTTEEQYPQHISIEFQQDKCGLLDNYQVGQEVKVSINLRGREWTSPQGETKYFNTITGWRIESLNPVMTTGNATTMTGVPETKEEVSNFKEEEHDDLPFN